MATTQPESWTLVQYWPAIVQAFAAVVALVLSIYIPIRIRALDRAAARHEQFQKANALARFIVADIFGIYEKALRAAVFLNHDHKKETFPLQTVRDELLIEASEKLQTKAQDFWLFGQDAGGAVNRAVSDGLYLNEKVRRSFTGEYVTLEQLRGFSAIYLDTFVQVRDTAEQAVELLSKQYDLRA